MENSKESKGEGQKMSGSIYKCPLCSFEMWFMSKNELYRHLTHGYMIQTKQSEYQNVTHEQWLKGFSRKKYFCGNNSPYHKNLVWWDNKNNLIIKLDGKWQKFKIEKFKVKVEKDNYGKWIVKTRKKTTYENT
jgi:hypothetical protein